MCESCGHHCQDTKVGKGESNSELWECQWNLQRDFSGGPEEKDHCRQEKVLIMKRFFVISEGETAIKFQEPKISLIYCEGLRM